MKYLILTLLLASCSMKPIVRHEINGGEKPEQIKKSEFKPRNQKQEDCIERFIRLGATPREALDVCKEIYK